MKKIKKLLRDKSGSYLVEASIILPIFILATLMLITIVPILSCFENVTYVCADEIRFFAASSGVKDVMAAYPAAVTVRVHSENPALDSFRLTSFRKSYKKKGIEDLTTLSYRVTINQKTAFGLRGKAQSKGRITARSWTGAHHKNSYASAEDRELVWIFPEQGRKTHRENCTHVKASCRQVTLTDYVKKHYHSCPNCDSSGAEIGTQVFVFGKFGEAYHYGNCKSVKKACIEVRRGDAKKKGYTRCSKCGG